MDYTVDAVRQEGLSPRAHNAKLRLLKELENFDADLHAKLRNDLQTTERRFQTLRSDLHTSESHKSRFHSTDSFYVIGGGEERSVDGRIRSENERNHARTKASLNAPTSGLRTKTCTGDEEPDMDPDSKDLEDTDELPSEEPQKKKTWAFFNQF